MFGNCEGRDRFRVFVEADREGSLLLISQDAGSRRIGVSYRVGLGKVQRREATLAEQPASYLEDQVARMELIAGEQGLRANPLYSRSVATHAYYWLIEECSKGRYGYAIFQSPIVGVGGVDGLALARIHSIALKAAKLANLPSGFFEAVY
jgi:hypothetical protein